MEKRVAKTISIMQLLAMFDTEDKAVAWLENQRWGGVPTCPHCKNQDNISVPKSKKYTYWCKPCRANFTVKTDTIMHSSKLPTQKWVVAMYYMMTARKGISSLQLSKELGITQKSAWFMLQRLREGCFERDFKLSNIVEVDETYIGGKEKNRHNSKKLKAGRGGVGKQAIIGAKERNGDVKARVIKHTDGATLKGFIHDSVEVGSTVYTDEHKGYNDLEGLFYRHGTVKHSAKEYVNGMAHTNGIESVWAVLKRGYNGVYHNWSVKHMHRYINEFTFRLNEGNVEIDTLDRMASLSKNIGGKRLTYRELVSNYVAG